MSRPATASLSAVVIAGSEHDKNVFMGSLMYRLGVDLPLMERLQQAGKSQYADIVPFMRTANIDRTFNLPHHSCALVDNIEDADVLIFIIDATATQIDSLSFLQGERGKQASQQSSKRIILVDKMQDVRWDPQKYGDIVRDIHKALGDRSEPKQSLRFVPISSVSGDNFLELSEKSKWYASGSLSAGASHDPVTVVEAIDS